MSPSGGAGVVRHGGGAGRATETAATANPAAGIDRHPVILHAIRGIAGNQDRGPLLLPMRHSVGIRPRGYTGGDRGGESMLPRLALATAFARQDRLGHRVQVETCADSRPTSSSFPVWRATATWSPVPVGIDIVHTIPRPKVALESTVAAVGLYLPSIVAVLPDSCVTASALRARRRRRPAAATCAKCRKARICSRTTFSGRFVTAAGRGSLPRFSTACIHGGAAGQQPSAGIAAASGRHHNIDVHLGQQRRSGWRRRRVGAGDRQTRRTRGTCRRIRPHAGRLQRPMTARSAVKA